MVQSVKVKANSQAKAQFLGLSRGVYYKYDEAKDQRWKVNYYYGE